MARTKPTAASQSNESGPEGGEPEPQATDAGESETSRKISKTDAIRAAVAAGHDSPGPGVDFIKKRFGLELSKQHFSATKSKLKSSEQAPSSKARQSPAAARKKAAPVEGYLAPPEQPAGGDGNLLDALEAIKPLIAQHGAESVKRMVDLLG